MAENSEKVDQEQIKKDIKTILDGSYPEEEIALLGENRGQLFVRIPKIVTDRMKLKKGQKILFKVYNKKDKKPAFVIEVCKDGSA